MSRRTEAVFLLAGVVAVAAVFVIVPARVLSYRVGHDAPPTQGYNCPYDDVLFSARLKCSEPGPHTIVVRCLWMPDGGVALHGAKEEAVP